MLALPYESKETDKISEALCNAQGEFPSIQFNRTNKFLKGADYADLDQIVRGIKPIMKKNGLSFTQTTMIIENKDNPILTTRIRHKSGQWFESRIEVVPESSEVSKSKTASQYPSRPKSQNVLYGISMSYMKRYQLAAALGITTSDDPCDNDAGEQVANPYSGDTITPAQTMELSGLLTGHSDISHKLIDEYKIRALSNLPRDKFESVIKRVKKSIEIKNSHNT